MNFFKAIAGFFQKDSVKAFLDLALKILKMVLGQTGVMLQTIAQEEVAKAEASGKTGLEKYEMAYKAIKKRFPEVRESAVNLAIELAVNALVQGKG